MKKILIFSLSYYPHVGGAEVAVKEITDRLPDMEFHMVTLRYSASLPKEERIGNVMVHRVGQGQGRLGKFLFQFRAATVASSLHKVHSYDAVWAIMAHSAGVPAAIFKMRHPHVPYILTLQEGDPPEHVERVMRPLWPLFSRAFTLADQVQAISTFLGAWARRRGFTGPLEIIPNGASAESGKNYSDEELQELREQLRSKEGEVFLLTVSRLVHQKGLDTVIRALTFLPTTVRYVLVGDGPEKESLRELAKQLNVSERVTFVGQVDRSMTAKYRKVCDIFVHPSRSEGQGIALVTSMLAGIPIVATQVGGIADFLFDAKRNPDKEPTGWAVDVDRPDQIAAAVKEILAHPDQRKAVVANARTLAQTTYNWDAIARAMREKVFNQVL
jgi:glycosyltransferase involved in cell wall biosynthesis